MGRRNEMVCSKIKDLIWINDNITEQEEELIQSHVRNCSECRGELETKKRFEKDIKIYKDKVIFNNTIIRRGGMRKTFERLIGLVACFIIIVFIFIPSINPTFAQNAKDNIYGAFSIVSNLFGGEHLADEGLIQEGTSSEKDNIQISVKSIGITKRNLTLFFTIKDTRNNYTSCRPNNIELVINGERYPMYGTSANDYVNKLSYGDFYVDFKDNLIPSKAILRVKGFTIGENDFLSVKDDSVYKEYELTGIWEVPIELNKELIQKAEYKYKQYNLDYKFVKDDLIFDFNKFVMEPARSTIEYNVTSQNSFRGFGDVKVFSEDNSILAENKFDNYLVPVKRDGSIENSLDGFIRSNQTSEINLVPIDLNESVSKIVIGSYLKYDCISNLKLNMKDLISSSEINKTIDIGDVSIILEKLNDNDNTYIIKINILSEKKLDVKLLDSKNVVEANELVTNKKDNGEPIGLNASYNITDSQDYYTFEFWSAVEVPISIEIPVTTWQD